MNQMNNLRYTLLSDGSSDRALIPILNWILRESDVHMIQPSWADLARLRRPPQHLAERISRTVELYPCDILFIHRDAERMNRVSRVEEIAGGYNQARVALAPPPYVCVVPVRMTEAWLLFDESAIRYASGNTSGRISLELPGLNHLESSPNPKELLHELLRRASGLTGRRLKKFRPDQRIHRIAEVIDDFSSLRSLPAFSALEDDVQVRLSSLARNP